MDFASLSLQAKGPKWQPATPESFSTFVRQLQRYSVKCQASYILFGDRCKVPAPTGSGAEAKRLQANALMMIALEEAVDELTLDRIVGATEIDFDAATLFACFEEHAKGAALPGVTVDTIMDSIYSWTWPAVGTNEKQVQTAISELKRFQEMVNRLDSADLKISEQQLCMQFRKQMPLPFQQHERAYREYTTFAALMPQASHDAVMLDKHPEKFAVLTTAANMSAPGMEVLQDARKAPKQWAPGRANADNIRQFRKGLRPGEILCRRDSLGNLIPI